MTSLPHKMAAALLVLMVVLFVVRLAAGSSCHYSQVNRAQDRAEKASDPVLAVLTALMQ